jgi:hypothetical protein
MISETEFHFPEGSVIKICRTGMITLISSDNTIPKIYVPCLINTSMALATDTEFCGLEYHRREAPASLVLTSAGKRELDIIRLLKEHQDIELAIAKAQVLTAPSTIYRRTAYSRALTLSEKLESTSASTSVTILEEKIKYPEQEVITVEDFFKKHVDAFIQTILNHGA